MEVKKNPSKDVHRMRSMFFQIGLGISVALMITAFEWRTEVKKISLRVIDGGPIELVPVIPNTNPKDPPPPSPIKNEVKPSANASYTPIALTSAIVEPSTELPLIDPTLLHSIPFVPEVDDPEPCDNCIVFFPEEQAAPIGGYEGFYKMLKDNLKYPLKAARYDVKGKVFVEFVVNRDGTPVDMKVIRGIGYGCDEEAKRVIGLSKWNPGKQRGRPVRVKMVMTIIFQLNSY